MSENHPKYGVKIKRFNLVQSKISPFSDDLDFSDDETGMKGTVPAVNNNALKFDFKPMENPPLIVDVGSMWTRIGFSAEETPKEIQRTMIGELRKTLTNKEATYYGQDVVSRLGVTL